MFWKCGLFTGMGLVVGTKDNHSLFVFAGTCSIRARLIIYMLDRLRLAISK